MNTERVLKIFEWRVSLSTSSEGRYEPDKWSDVEESFEDLIKQVGEFKKKQFKIDLSTSLDTTEMEDMDVAILVCAVESTFGLKTIPSEALRKMETIRDLAEYAWKNKPEKKEGKDEKEEDKGSTKKKEKKKKEINVELPQKVGCLGSTFVGMVFLFGGGLFAKLFEALGISMGISAILGIVASIFASVYTYGLIAKFNSKKE
ncbi:MAG: hypothetical protein Q4C30_07250 [Bacteroidia bacterium]|nr:hypothetical protein [Bacteroidia bacterium]